MAIAALGAFPLIGTQLDLTHSIFSVQTYGAQGDGVTDDYTAIVTALTALNANGGGILYFPKGDFITSQQIAVQAGTMIMGAGIGISSVRRKSNSIANGHANNSGAVFFGNSGTAGLVDPGTHMNFVALKDLTLDGNAAGNPGVTNANLGCHGFRANYTDFIYAENVEFKNCLSTGLYLFGCSKSRFIGCISHNNGQISVADSRNGFGITGPQDDATNRGVQDEHIFIGCEAYGNTDEGFAVGRNGRIVLNGCIAHSNGDMGIEGDSGTATSDTSSVPAGWTITGCHCYSNGTHGIGIANANVQRIIVVGNILEDNPKCGVTLGQSSGALAIVSNNIIRNFGTSTSGDHGIIIGTFDRAVVSDNLLDGTTSCLSTGIVFIAQTTVRHIAVTGNVVFQAGGGGFSLAGAATGVIADNQFNTTLSVFTNAFAISGGSSGAVVDLDIHGNTCLNAISRGMFIRTNGTAALTRIRLRNNTSRGNGTFGLEISESGGGVITGLALEGNDFAGNTSGAITGTPAAGFSIKRNNRLSTDAAHGRAVLVNSTVTVSTAEVQAADNIALTRVVGAGTTRGVLTIGTITAGVSFVIEATTLSGTLSADDDSTVFWEIIH